MTEECPYCDGTLNALDGREKMYCCSNEGNCPATFVTVIGYE